jgi:hypothetical protein
MPGLLLAAPEHTCYNRLGQDTSMVATRQVKGLVVLHTVPSDKDVLEHRYERVTTVQFPSDVGGWDGYREAALF